MNKLEAIAYLVSNAARSSEWQEAGMLHAIENVVEGTDEWNAVELDQLIELARSN